MKSIATPTFSEFVEYFPLLELPVSLLPDLRQIPSDPEPIPSAMLETFILPFEGNETDEYTEYVPYGRLAPAQNYQAIIYWKAGVLRYEFILAIYALKGEPLSHAIVGGLRYEDEGALHSVAYIDENGRITIAEGLMDRDEKNTEPTVTQTYQMVISPDGIISYDSNEEETQA